LQLVLSSLHLVFHSSRAPPPRPPFVLRDS
jgi:hypothetical protein